MKNSNLDRWSAMLGSLVIGSVAAGTGCATEAGEPSAPAENVSSVKQAHTDGNFDCYENHDCGGGGQCHTDGAGGTMCSWPSPPPPPEPPGGYYCYDGQCYWDYTGWPRS